MSLLGMVRPRVSRNRTMKNVLLFLGPTGFILVLANFLDDAQCTTRWADIYPATFSFMGGCRVQVNGQWIPESAIKIKVTP
jgi:hypothetical protein